MPSFMTVTRDFNWKVLRAPVGGLWGQPVTDVSGFLSGDAAMIPTVFLGAQTPIPPSWMDCFCPRDPQRLWSAFAGVHRRRKARNAAEGVGNYTWTPKHIHKLWLAPPFRTHATYRYFLSIYVASFAKDR